MRALPILLSLALALALALATTIALPADTRAEPPMWVCDSPEARQFDFWLGEWNVVNKRRGTDDSWQEMGSAAAKIYSVLGGCAVVEHWRGMAWDRKTFGLSVRYFDRAAGQWILLLSWPSQDQPGFGQLRGSFTHGRGEFFSEGENPEGQKTMTRYSFADIRPDAFRWDAANSEDDGGQWRTYWIMEFSRRHPTELPLFHGPWIHDGRSRHCGQPEAAQLDFLGGAWEGVERRPDGSERPARVTAYPILEGCALMDLTEVDGGGEGGYRRFGVRAWSAAEKRWIQHEIDTVEPVLTEATGDGATGDGAVTFVAGEPGKERTRVTWSLRDDGFLLRSDSRSENGGATWNAVRELELRPTSFGGWDTPNLQAARRLERVLREEGAAVLESTFREMRDAAPGFPGQQLLNALGYKLLRDGDPGAAVQALRLNAETFPGSANVHDSLGEAYMATGDQALAMASYKRSLEIDSDNANARRMIDKLEAETE